MAEYIERESLVRQIICNMTEFIGAPDDVQKHDEQCNYAIDMIEDATASDVAPVVHGRWVSWVNKVGYLVWCSECNKHNNTEKTHYCPNCGAKMDGGDSDEAD